MNRMNRRTRRDWQKIVEEYSLSKQTQTAFAEGRDFHPTTLSYWLRRLAPKHSSGVISDFVEITHAVSPPRETGTVLEIDAAGRLKFQELPPPDYVAQLLAALHRC